MSDPTVEFSERNRSGPAARPGEAVGGAYAITGTLPTLADVVSFTKGSAELDHGYYRFVSHPRLRRLEEELKTAFGCRHCRLAESLEVALAELLLCLRASGVHGRIVVLREESSTVPAIDASLLPASEREGVSMIVLADPRAVPSDLGRDDILLLMDPIAPVAPVAEPARARGASVVAVLTSGRGALPKPRADVAQAGFFVLGLGSSRGLRGAAVLGNSDRLMDRLAQQMRRRGPVLSSRVAGSLLEAHGLEKGLPPGTSARDGTADARALDRVADELCRLEGGSRAILYCSGMSAISRVLDILRQPGRSQVVAVGHLYNDTFQALRLTDRKPGEEPNLFPGVDELDALDALVGAQTAAILTESITNPLSDVPDLTVLSRIARRRGVPLVVDNTLATPLNCNPLALGADYVVHSTTKYLNGRNDHGGGAVVVGDPRLAEALAERQSLLDDRMSALEAAVLEGNLRSFPERMERFNANAVRVASFLAGHRAVGRLFFNGLPSHRCHATARRLLRGPGSVISFTLTKESRGVFRAFYDSPLAGILKAPGLGSDVTLLCPYTLLTLPGESDKELAAIGLPRYLARIAVGCERDITPVIESLEEALQTSLSAAADAPPSRT